MQIIFLLVPTFSVPTFCFQPFKRREVRETIHRETKKIFLSYYDIAKNTVSKYNTALQHSSWANAVKRSI
jgi:hypothetical protein